jgi:hypothetical protein
MSQFREGSFGRFVNHEDGMPVYSRADTRPDFRGGVASGGVDAAEVDATCSVLMGQSKTVEQCRTRKLEKYRIPHVIKYALFPLLLLIPVFCGLRSAGDGL